MTEEPYVDLDQAMGRLKGNKTVYRKMLQLFLNSTEPEQLEEYVSLEDYSNAFAAAHAIKGMAGNLSMTALYRLSEQLMLELRRQTPDPYLLDRFRNTVLQTRLKARQICDECA